jgi:hypothetical protein
MQISRIIGKLCSALIVCILLTLLVEHEYTSRRHMSREDYLAKQSERYDRQVHASSSSIVVTFLASAFLGCIFLGVYELIGFGISQATKSLDE